MRYVLVIAAMCAATVMMVSCSNRKGTSPASETETAVVSGKVMAAVCFSYQYSSPTFRYTEETGFPVTLDFYGPEGKQYQAITDEHSEYSVELDTGMYSVVVDYWHGWPYRYHNIHIGADTTFDPALSFAYMWPDTVICSFHYDSTRARLTEQQEMDYLESLNDLSTWSGWPPLNLEAAHRIAREWDHGFATVSYYVPQRESWRVWEVVDVCRSTLLQFPNRFPDYLDIEANLVTCAFYDTPQAGPVDIDCGGVGSP